MNGLLAAVVRAFMPLALVAGAMLAAPSARKTRKAARRLAAGAIAGLAAAAALHLLAAPGRPLTAARLVLDWVAAAAALLYAGLVPFASGERSLSFRKAHSRSAVAFVAALAAASAFAFLDLLRARALSSAAVVNTELIVNVGALLLGAAWIALLVPLTARLAARGGRLRAGFLLAASALIVLPRSGEILLGLMRLELVEKSGGGLSFIAKVGQISTAAPYLELALLAALAAVFYRRRSVVAPGELAAMPDVQRRKAVSRMRADGRWSAAAAAACAALLLLLTYDSYASRPPRLSRSDALSADADGFLRVKIDRVSDGRLHRFSHLTADGQFVRFFLIQRGVDRAGRPRIGVVYDACMMCGDKGYVQRKNGVFCLACEVRIRTPSIGKPGGCNPIPLEHRLEGDSIAISAEELGKGAVYFAQATADAAAR